MRPVPRWARDTGSGPQLVQAANDEMMLDVRRERLQVPPEIRSLPVDRQRALVEFNEEQRALRMPSRGGRKWQAIGDYDRRVLGLQRQQGDLLNEAAGLRERLQVVEQSDSQRLASWHEQGQQGERPHPEKAELEQRLARIDADARALDFIVDEALDAKERHVSRHRKRLSREALADVERAHGAYIELIRGLERAREELTEARRTLRWSTSFPSEQATSDDLQPTLLAGGLMKPVKRALGITSAVAFTSMVDALEADAATLRDGLPQREGDDIREPLWLDTDAGRKAQNRERQRLRDAAEQRNLVSAWWEE
jgi:hypothetical protein